VLGEGAMEMGMLAIGRQPPDAVEHLPVHSLSVTKASPSSIRPSSVPSSQELIGA